MRLNDYTVPNTSIKIRVNCRIETKSLSGKTSSTDRVNNGIKPKVFNVSIIIAFEDAQDLTDLVTTSESTGDSGKLTVYDIVDKTANALNVRQVTFTDNFTVKEMPKNSGWRVSFTLIEYLSVPEKVEQRKRVTTATAQSSDGNAVSASDDQTTESTTGFERFLLKVDKALE